MNKKIIAMAAGLLMLTGCAADTATNGATDTVSATDEITDTVSATDEITDTATEATTQETTTETTTQETTTEATTQETTETTTEVTTETTTEATTETEETTINSPSSDKAVSFDYVDFYESIGMELSFPLDAVPDEVSNAAKEALKKNDRYNDFINYDPDNTDNEELSLPDFESYLVDGVPAAKLLCSLYDDFDGDGAKEAFMMYDMPFYFSEPGDSEGGNRLAVFVNSSCEADVIYQGYGEIGGKIMYDGFTHIVICGGSNNASNKTEIFYVKDNAAVQGYRYDWTMVFDDEYDVIFEDSPVLYEENITVVSWDNEQSCYITTEISPQEAMEIGWL